MVLLSVADRLAPSLETMLERARKALAESERDRLIARLVELREELKDTKLRDRIAPIETAVKESGDRIKNKRWEEAIAICKSATIMADGLQREAATPILRIETNRGAFTARILDGSDAVEQIRAALSGAPQPPETAAAKPDDKAPIVIESVRPENPKTVK